MPEVGPVDENHTVTLGNPAESEIVGELFLSSDVIKSADFNPEDHVILVVPESSGHLTDEENGAGYIIPSSEDADGLSDVDPNRLRETIKSNFLVIAKLLPSKSPPPLVPIVSSKLTGEVLKVDQEASDVPVLHKLPSTARAAVPKTPVRTRQPRTPRSPGVRTHTIKQEGPEIFGKMFPASYNEVMYKQIREIILFKCGKDTSEETQVAEGINCPHCRKKPLTLGLLKEHLASCHTYSSTKRKNPSPASTSVIKKTLFRCQYCDEAFISQAHRESHECSLTVKPLEPVKDATEPISVCEFCHQEFGGPSELECHQQCDHKDELKKKTHLVKHPAAESGTSLPVTSPKTYATCHICDKRVSSSLKEEHLKRHRDHSSGTALGETPKCVKCSQPGDLNSDGRCSSCADSSSQGSTDATAICPNCDLEVDAACFHEHVASHRNDPIAEDEFVDRESFAMVRIAVCSTCQDEFKVPADSNKAATEKCKKCGNM